MAPHPRSRGVVVMGKLPRPGRVKTRLGLAPRVAAELYRAFLTDVFGAVDAALRRRPGKAVFACALEPGDSLSKAVALAPPGWAVVAQEGADLGARMRHAWRSVEVEGAVVIGSDLPLLAPAKLVEALDGLADGRVVLVPALDGGYVLVGLTRDEPAIFEGIRWSTATVLAETERRARAAGIEVLRLGPEPDVDTLEDLDRVRPHLPPGSETRRALARLELEASLSAARPEE